MTNAHSSNAGVLAVDLGGTRLRVAIFGDDGELLHKTVVPTPSEEPQALVQAMQRALEACDIKVSGAAVGVPGPVNYGDGTVVRLPNLPGWETPISSAGLSEELGLRVYLANDADLAALGEYRFGAGQGTADMLYVTSSTGVGAGVVIGGKLLHGAWSLAEVGHTIIEHTTGRTVEDLGSGTALARLAGVDGATVAARAEAGDEEAQRLFRLAADAFATGVYNLAHCFMPERVVIGGGMSRAGDLLLDPVRRQLARCGPGCPAAACDVVVACAGDDVGLLGAFAFWLDSTGA